MPNFTLTIKTGSKQFKDIIARLESRVKLARNGREEREDKWRKAEEAMLAYTPELPEDSKRRLRRDAGKPEYTTIVIPYTYAMAMTMHTYLTSVFLSRTPVHQFAGYSDEGENQVLAMETVMNYQVNAGEMMGPYFIWFYDSIKYGEGWVGQYWHKEETAYGQITLDSKGKTNYSSILIPGYEGMKIYNLSPFDAMSDPRVPVGQFQKGEFFIAHRNIPWNELLKRQEQGYLVNVSEIKNEFGSRDRDRGESGQLRRPDISLYSDETATHPAVLSCYEIYIELLPKDWGLGKSSYPEKWVFTVPEDMTCVLGAMPLGAIHGKFPFNVLETEIEAYGLHNRGTAEVMEPVQRTMDWLVNSHFYNVRAALNNQFVIDPSRVYMSDVGKASAGFMWRLRPEAFGTPVDQAIKQFPVTDVTQANMRDLDAMFGIGQRVFGISDQLMGMMETGGRPTATQIRTTTGFGVNRQKTIAEYQSATGFGQHAQMMCQTTQQYFSAEKKLRIAGSQALIAGPGWLTVNPADIAGNFMFVPVDGTLPIDRFAQVTLWKDLMQNVMGIPQIAQSYDWMRIFAYIAQLAGLKNVERFKIQIAPPGVNPGAAGMVPLGAPGATNASTLGGGNAIASGIAAGAA